MDWERICRQAVILIRDVGKFIREENKKLTQEQVHSKSKNNLVSYVDTASERKLVDGLRQIFPTAGFLTEEKTVAQTQAEYQWIIDPLDGTTNYIHGIPLYATSVALARNQQIVLGVVYEICRDEMFYAWQESPVFANEQVVKISCVNSLQNALLSTGFPYACLSKADNYTNLLNHLMRNCQGIRRPGAAAVDLAYVACGRFDGFFEYGLQPWDVAAGAFLIEQSGGKVSDFKGSNDFLMGQQIVAGTPQVHIELLEIVRRYF